MNKKNKLGFTLSEVLITLAVVGIIAVLVIPGLIKDANNRAMVSLLEGTVSGFTNAIQNELLASGTTQIKDTDVHNKPKEFLKKRFDVKKSCSSEITVGDESSITSKCFSGSYRDLSGNFYNNATENPVLLASGVAIDIKTGSKDEKYIPVSIDLNGTQSPNILGVDFWEIYIALETDEENGIRSGDVGNRDDSSTLEELKSSCMSGTSSACYSLLVKKGFDANYLE